MNEIDIVSTLCLLLHFYFIIIMIIVYAYHTRIDLDFIACIYLSLSIMHIMLIAAELH